MSAGMHTPGPWVAHYLPQHRMRVTNVDGSVSICDVALWNTDYEEQIANARLIAAAPLLLDALKGLLPILEAVRYTAGLSGTQIKRMEAAKAALAAATQADAGEGR